MGNLEAYNYKKSNVYHKVWQLRPLLYLLIKIWTHYVHDSRSFYGPYTRIGWDAFHNEDSPYAPIDCIMLRTESCEGAVIIILLLFLK